MVILKILDAIPSFHEAAYLSFLVAPDFHPKNQFLCVYSRITQCYMPIPSYPPSLEAVYPSFFVALHFHPMV